MSARSRLLRSSATRGQLLADCAPGWRTDLARWRQSAERFCATIRSSPGLTCKLGIGQTHGRLRPSRQAAARSRSAIEIIAGSFQMMRARVPDTNNRSPYKAIADPDNQTNPCSDRRGHPHCLWFRRTSFTQPTCEPGELCGYRRRHRTPSPPRTRYEFACACSI